MCVCIHIRFFYVSQINERLSSSNVRLDLAVGNEVSPRVHKQNKHDKQSQKEPSATPFNWITLIIMVGTCSSRSSSDDHFCKTLHSITGRHDCGHVGVGLVVSCRHGVDLHHPVRTGQCGGNVLVFVRPVSSANVWPVPRVYEVGGTSFLPN